MLPGIQSRVSCEAQSFKVTDNSDYTVNSRLRDVPTFQLFSHSSPICPSVLVRPQYGHVRCSPTITAWILLP